MRDRIWAIGVSVSAIPVPVPICRKRTTERACELRNTSRDVAAVPVPDPTIRADLKRLFPRRGRRADNAARLRLRGRLLSGHRGVSGRHLISGRHRGRGRSRRRARRARIDLDNRPVVARASDANRHVDVDRLRLAGGGDSSGRLVRRDRLGRDRVVRRSIRRFRRDIRGLRGAYRRDRRRLRRVRSRRQRRGGRRHGRKHRLGQLHGRCRDRGRVGGNRRRVGERRYLRQYRRRPLRGSSWRRKPRRSDDHDRRQRRAPQPRSRTSKAHRKEIPGWIDDDPFFSLFRVHAGDLLPTPAAIRYLRPMRTLERGNMSAESESLLQAWCDDHDLDARARLIEQYLPLVRALARRFSNGAEQLDDLAQVGALGLIKAVDRYDPRCGGSARRLCDPDDPRRDPPLPPRQRLAAAAATRPARASSRARSATGRARGRARSLADSARAGYRDGASRRSGHCGAGRAGERPARPGRVGADRRRGRRGHPPARARRRAGDAGARTSTSRPAGAPDRAAPLLRWPQPAQDRSRGRPLAGSRQQAARAVARQAAQGDRTALSARDTTPKRLSTRFQRRTIVGMAGRTARAALVSSDQDKPDQGEKAPSGRLLLRMPRTLHAELARAAEREGTSLNGFITGALASTIGWRGEDGESGAGSSDSRERARDPADAAAAGRARRERRRRRRCCPGGARRPARRLARLTGRPTGPASRGTRRLPRSGRAGTG